MSKPLVPGWTLSETAMDGIRELKIDLEEVRDLMAQPIRITPGAEGTKKYISEALEAYVNEGMRKIIHVHKRDQARLTPEQRDHLRELRVMDEERELAHRLAHPAPFVPYASFLRKRAVRHQFGPISVRKIGDPSEPD